MASKKTRKSINYEKLAQMWNAGKTYEQMGQALGMKGQEKADPWKPVRAAISNMLRGKAAWYDSKDNPKVLPPREGMRAIGVGKKIAKAAKRAKAAVEKKYRSPKKAKVRKAYSKLVNKLPKLDGKQLASREKAGEQ